MLAERANSTNKNCLTQVKTFHQSPGSNGADFPETYPVSPANPTAVVFGAVCVAKAVIQLSPSSAPIMDRIGLAVTSCLLQT